MTNKEKENKELEKEIEKLNKDIGDEQIKQFTFESEIDKQKLINLEYQEKINNSMNVNKNVFSEDNVNIHMTDTLISKQTTININNDNDNENKNDEIMPSNNLNYNNKKVNLIVMQKI